MEHLKSLMFGLLMAAGIVSAQAQIGYQISLLNTATGEPRANEKVNVNVTLTNNAGDIILTENKSATTNDFGVLSLTIGNANTFKDVDLSKLPFWIEVSANGVVIGKTQVLSVPVAEAAKRIAPALTKEELCSRTWYLFNSRMSVNFSSNGSVRLTMGEDETYTGSYEIEGPCLWLYINVSGDFEGLILRYHKGELHIMGSVF